MFDTRTRYFVVRWALLALVAIGCWGCGEEEEPAADAGAVNPCGDACPIEQCNISFKICTGGGDDMGDAGGDADVSDVIDADAVEEIAEEVPDADVEEEPDVDAADGADEGDVGGCVGDDDCGDGEICDVSGESPVCRPGCRGDDDCGEGESCDPVGLVCGLGCFEDEDCGPESGRQVCRVEDQTCVRAECRVSTQCAVGSYCDRGVFPPVCAEGCDVGLCPRGEYCELESRQCFGGCEGDRGCEDPETWCDVTDHVCRPGCREGECPAGEVCYTVEGDGEPARECVPDACEGDEACRAGEFCGVEARLGRMICQEGCRVSPDSCSEGLRCEAESRRCVAATCEGDGDCGEGEICGDGEPRACRLGCREDGDCPGAQRCDEGLLLCVCEARSDCVMGETCVGGQCVPACASDADCAVPGEVCNTTSGQCAQGCTGDVDCDFEGTARECDRRTRSCVVADCARDRDCPEVAWCDLEAGQCALGCRAEGCPQGQFCDLVARQCVAGCTQDDECSPEQFCDEAVSRCFVGCRGDEACGPGTRCQEVVVGQVPGRQCLPPACDADAACEAGQYCGEALEGLSQTYCVPGCRVSPDSCPRDQSCDPELRQCVRSACGADADCEGDEVCDAGRCRVGCRGDEQCALGQSCEGGARACLCAEDGDCQRNQICGRGLCVERCVNDLGCGGGERCDVSSGLCEEGCEGDEGCGDGARCDLALGFCVGVGCEGDGDCGADRYCDLEREAPRCEPGCREGGCPQGSQCLLSQRVCAERCVVDGDCAAGRYCDPDSGQCEVGCRGEQDCVGGQVCLEVLQEGREVRACVAPSCASDVGCAEDEFCGFDAESGRDICRVGCRVAPDSCDEGQRCDEVRRACVEDLCVVDGDCPAGRVCSPGLGGLSCEIGCREDGQCGQGFACEQGRCQCEVREDCAPGLACDGGFCQAPCASDGQCGVDEICDQALGVCREGCRLDGDCVGEGPGLVCDQRALLCLGRPCRLDAQCGDNQYCAEGGRCEEGCREGGCPGGQFCALETRSCVRGCLQNRDCLVGTYCDVEARACRVGCRGDLECGGGLRCQEVEINGAPARRCLAPACAVDGDCAANQYCGEDITFARRVCLGGCRRSPDNCPPQQRCSEDLRICEASSCAGDGDCGQGEICQVLNGGPVCVPGCREDGQCAPGGGCEEDLQRCGCEEDAQCFEGEVCVAGLCEEPCTTAGCPEGFACESVSGQCSPSCASDEDCDPANTGLRCDVEAEICVLTVCASDEDCLAANYCELGLEQPVCAPGCRVGGCPEGQFCQPQQRQCLEGCALDEQCPEGTFCGPDDGQCRAGCRGDEECGEGLRCQRVEGDFGIEQVCLPPRCAVDADCAASQFCAEGPFGQEAVCLPGCRVSPDNCPQGRQCSPTQRQCLDAAACVADEGCGEGEICREDLGGFCGVGCRGEGECGVGQSCDPFALRCTCNGPRGCGPGQACDGFFCLDACQEDLDCPDGQACEVESGLCRFVCEEDAYEPNDDFLSPAALTLPGAEGLRMCNLDGQGRQDCYALELSAGRYEVLLSFAHREGDLNLEIFDPDLFLVEILSSADDDEEAEVMARAGRYTFCVLPAGAFASEYSLRVEAR
jgi:hypothetical protein